MGLYKGNDARPIEESVFPAANSLGMRMEAGEEKGGGVSGEASLS